MGRNSKRSSRTFFPVFLGFIHLRLRQKLLLCSLGNNLVTLGLHGEQFQKIVRNFISSILRSNVASSVGESQHIPVDPAEEQRLMSWCRLQLGDQSVRDKFMALETLLVLMNLKMKTSCNIRKDLPVALKMPERLTDQGRSFVNQRNKCVNFSQLSFSSYLLKCETLFININNPTSNIMTSNSRTSSSNKTMTKQTTSNNIMSSRDTLAMTILIIELATQNYY